MLTRLLFAGAAGAAVLSTGCSMAFVDGPPNYIPAEDPVPPDACTAEMIYPAADAVGAVVFAIAAITGSEGNEVRVGAVGAGALGFSAYSGYRRVSDCRDRMPRVDVNPIFPDSSSAVFPRGSVFPGSGSLEGSELGGLEGPKERKAADATR